MYTSMRSPQDFNSTLLLSFLIMFALYAFVGACGYALYGDASSILITEDMSTLAASDKCAPRLGSSACELAPKLWQLHILPAFSCLADVQRAATTTVCAVSLGPSSSTSCWRE